eukprot:PhF_6_TR19815/c0_g1_i4/m.28892
MNWFCFFYCLQLVLTTVEAATCLFNLGAYLSDTDGSGSATPAPGYACDATLTCPTGMVVGITLLRGSLDTDALKFYDSTKDAINPEDLLLWNPFVCRYPPCGPASDSKMLTSNRVRVNYVSGSGNGFDLTYNCAAGATFAPTPVPLTVSPTVVATPVASVPTSSYPPTPVTCSPCNVVVNSVAVDDPTGLCVSPYGGLVRQTVRKMCGPSNCIREEDGELACICHQGYSGAQCKDHICKSSRKGTMDAYQLPMFQAGFNVFTGLESSPIFEIPPNALVLQFFSTQELSSVSTSDVSIESSATLTNKVAERYVFDEIRLSATKAGSVNIFSGEAVIRRLPEYNEVLKLITVSTNVQQHVLKISKHSIREYLPLATLFVNRTRNMKSLNDVADLIELYGTHYVRELTWGGYYYIQKAVCQNQGQNSAIGTSGTQMTKKGGSTMIDCDPRTVPQLWQTGVREMPIPVGARYSSLRDVIRMVSEESLSIFDTYIEEVLTNLGKRYPFSANSTTEDPKQICAEEAKEVVQTSKKNSGCNIHVVNWTIVVLTLIL